MVRDNSVKKTNIQTSCKRCGICCTKGGAALHTEDLPLLLEKKIPRSDCITLRKGELAWNPENEQLEAIKTDIIKLRGSKGQWACCYLDLHGGGCRIYANRPLACRTLKCWEPEESLALAGRDLLSRQAILQGEEALIHLIEAHEKKCPLPDFTTLQQSRSKPAVSIDQLQEMVNRDLHFREKLVVESRQIANEELFLFGRPLFQLLQPFGYTVIQEGEYLCLKKV